MSFPSTALDLHVELYINGGWVDISTYVIGKGRDAIPIRWGVADLSSAATPSSCTFTIYDPTGLFNNANPLSTYYGKLGLATRARVRVSSNIRMMGEVTKWAPVWSVSGGLNTTVKVTVSGVSRRLLQNSKPIKSPAFRTLTSTSSQANTIAYWPMEEDTAATALTPFIGSAPTLTSTLSIGAHTSHPATPRMVTLGTGGKIYCPAPTHTSTGEYKFAAVWNVPSSISDGARIYRCYFTGGTLGFIEVWVRDNTLTPTEQVVVWYYNTSRAAINTTSLACSGVLWGGEVTISIELTQVGGNLFATILVVGQTDTSIVSDSPVGAVTMGTWTGTIISPTDTIGDFPTNGVSASGASVGHFIVGNDTTAFADYISPNTDGALGTRAFVGEHASARMTRIFGDDGVSFSFYGNGNDTETLGKQPTNATLIGLARDCAAADRGVLCDARDSVAMYYRTRTSMYSQGPALQLTYSSHVSAPFAPSDDDFGAANRVTVSRSGGSSAVTEITDYDGYHATTDDPTVDPHGIGVYDIGLTLNLETDDQNKPMSAWIAHLGSWIEPRYVNLSVDLSRTSLASFQTSAPSVFVGDLITIDTTNGPKWLPSDRIELLAMGGQETLAQFDWRISWNTVPARPYEVWQVQTGGSTLVTAVNTSATTWRLSTSLGPEWDTLHEPYFIQAGGEAVKVTTMSTDTPAFIAAGTVAHGNNGASVVPGLPAGMTADAGQLMLLWAAVRNSGTGTVGTNPTGWTTLVDFGNTRLMYRYYVTGDTAPTVAFTGGAAGDDTSARIFGFSGLSHQFASGTKSVPAAYTQLNGSAQNVAYPALTVNRTSSAFIFAWKQDDATGYAPPSGFTEMSDDSTTTGNDQSIAAYYDLTAATAAAGSLVVTGGVSAISRAVVLALRPLQTATVVRNQNGVNVSVAAASAVTGWRLGVNGL